MGVCGVGMAGIAFLLKRRGWLVSGCDRRAAGRIADWLRSEGVEVADGHSPQHLEAGTDWVIRSAAVSPEEPELREAERKNVAVFRRGEVLPALLEGKISVAVCGTHGKTTTSTWMTFLLRQAGLDPSWCIGGRSSLLGEVAGVGNGRHMVVEADESDGTLSLYEADYLVVTNVDFDHMEHFANEEEFEGTFSRAMCAARKAVIYCRDDQRAAKLGGRCAGAVGYGFSEEADIRALNVRCGPWESEFDLVVRGRELGPVHVAAPGLHNVLNALACAATAMEMGLDAGIIRQALEKTALPARRFEVTANVAGAMVLSDYAHHPAEVRALVRTALKLGRRRILAVFQPHRYTRTRSLGAQFPPAFEGVDELVLLPVYSASEPPLAGGTAGDLYAAFREQGVCRRVLMASSRSQVWEYAKRRLMPGDLFLVIGAGDVDRIAEWARDWAGHGEERSCQCGLPELSPASRVAADEPLAPRTTFGVGGTADVWVEAGSVRDLAEVQRWASEKGLPVRVLGAGSNVLVSDMGLRGVTVRLAGGRFRRIERAQGGVRAGAGVTIPAFLSWCEREGVGGYEFLEGIPGTLGGAVRMNAGAWGFQLGDFVAEVVALDSSGATIMKRPGGPDGPVFGYRCSSNLGGIVLEVALKIGVRLDSCEISARRREIAAAREWMRGLRCAGSIFKNPDGDKAGRLIESAGLKGFRVGGAAVSQRHANVITADDGALASDVLALIEIVRSRVRATSGVDLEPEVVVLE